MSFYNRITIKENNLSGTVSVDVGSTGATVIRANKGPEKPAYFGRGQADLIKMIFGSPSGDFYQIREAIEYNNSRPLWISAPAGELGKFGGVLIFEDSVEGLPSGIGSLEDATLEILPVTNELFSNFSSGVLEYNHVLNFIKENKDWYIRKSIEGNSTLGYKLFFVYLDDSDGLYKRLNITTIPKDLQNVQIEYSEDFVTDNIIALNIGGTEMSPVTFSSDNATTYDNLKTAIESIIPEYATVVVDADNHLVKINNILVNTVTTEVTGGSSQATAIISYLDPTQEIYDFHLVSTSPDADITGVLSLNTDVESVDFMKASLVIDNLPSFLNTGYISISYDNNVKDDVLAIIASASKDGDESPNGKYVKITYNKKQNVFTMQSQLKQDGKTINISDYSFSLDKNKKDSSGKNIFIDEVFKDELVFQALGNSDYVFSDWVETTPAFHRLTGGERGNVDESVLNYATGWDYFKDKEKYPFDIAFNMSAKSSVIQQIFINLRNNFQKYSHYINCLPKGLDPNQNFSAISDVADATINNRGISQYWNWGFIKDVDSQETYWTPLTGRIARKFAIMDDVYNGLQPAMIDEDNHGGQLGAGILKMEYTVLDETLFDSFKDIRVNPIIKDKTYGVMAVSAYTTMLEDNDYSEIGHSRLADVLISNIIDNVLVYQVMKLNSATKRKLVETKITSILSPLKGEPLELLNDFIVICDDTNNTPEVKATKGFVVESRVQYTPFSEYVTLIFTTLGQTVSVTGTGI